MICRYLVAPLVLSLNIGCSKSDSDNRLWRPSDHDQESESAPSGQSFNTPSRANALTAGNSDDVLSVWDSLCAGCHGLAGKGNGPMGASLGARNLSDPRWQASMSDDQIASSILHGRGRMPAFSLPPETIKGLVRLIRGRQMSKRDDSTKP